MPIIKPLRALCLVGSLVAACSGPTYETAIPFVAVSPAVYVAKVKMILVGLPPTDAEVAAVVADPNALGGLVDGWMQLPQYGDKMQVFFELAFQQTQISDLNFVDIAPPNGLGNGKALPLLVQNARESYARTVLAITAAGRPLTDAFKTKQLMLTPALMQLYAYLDTHRADDLGKINDVFAKANPTVKITMENSAPRVSLVDATTPGNPSFLHFHNPDLATQAYPFAGCMGLDPYSIPIRSDLLFDIFYGELPPHNDATNELCPIHAGTGKGLQLDATDFTAWKLVTIRQPNAGEPTTQFFDIATLRSATELVLDTPRVGYFTTPAFDANWPTNASNQMRVTINQALIVATGAAIDGTDGTIPMTTPGLDADHAGPGTACFGCHQLLDPTRSVLASTYSWFYVPQTDAALIHQPGQFAFQHVVTPVQTIDDLATQLANHPLMPAAWVQKLCYYVNSAPCDPDDVEFQRIVGDFASSNFSWDRLVRDMMTSPITTNAAATKTHITNGEVIAVARRDHLCAALDNRLGFYDICQLDAADQIGTPTTIAQIVSGMPSDGYGRGSTIPVLPNQPTLFYRGGIENICVQVSQMVIDATPDPRQPGAKVWTSTAPDAAIAEFVALVMGLTPSDPRSAQVTTALTAHFTAAQAGPTPATATDALRSTFVVACLSPSFIGIGM